MRRLHLVRHGRPVVEPSRAARHWELDPAGLGAIDALRVSGRLPRGAAWFSSPEPKVLDTARGLADGEVAVVDELREHERGPTRWFDDLEEWREVVRRVFAEPDLSAMPGWEPLNATRDRVVPAVLRILAEHPGDEIVLTGHGTAWTMLRAELTGEGPDLDAWVALRMPDLWVVQAPALGLP